MTPPKLLVLHGNGFLELDQQAQFLCATILGVSIQLPQELVVGPNCWV